MELIVNNGKIVEPNKIEKAVAVIKRDKKVILSIPHEDMQQIMVDHIWNQSPWLKKYNRGLVTYNTETLDLTVTFSIAAAE